MDRVTEPELDRWPYAVRVDAHGVMWAVVNGDRVVKDDLTLQDAIDTANHLNAECERWRTGNL